MDEGGVEGGLTKASLSPPLFCPFHPRLFSPLPLPRMYRYIDPSTGQEKEAQGAWMALQSNGG